AERKFCYASPQNFAVLVNAAERNSQSRCIVSIAAADDGDVFRNSKSVVQDGHHCPHGSRVVVAKHPVGPWILLQEKLHCLIPHQIAGGVSVSAAYQKGFRHGNSLTGQCLTIALRALDGWT